MWQSLLANIAVVAIALLVWNAIGERLPNLEATASRLLFGMALGLGATASMALSFRVGGTIFYDLRAPLLVLAGFFGGWPAALVAGGMAMAFRMSMGGLVLIALAMIALAAATGPLIRAAMPGRVGVPHLLVLALLVAVELLPPLALAPAPLRPMLAANYWTAVTVSCAGTLVFGYLLLQEERSRELARVNRLYRSMVDALPDCLNIKDLDGRFLAANPATATLMRASSAEALLGRTDAHFYPPDMAAGFLADERRVLAGGVHETIEQRGRMADGSEGWLSTLKNPVFDEGGRLVGLVTHNRDITGARQMQAELDRTRAYLDQALETMKDGLAIYGADGRLILCNRRYRDMYPATYDLRVPGSHFSDILRATVERGEVALAEGMTTEDYVADRLQGLKLSAERTVETTDGRLLSGRTSLLPDGAALVMVSDVTEQRNFERNLRHRALHDPLTGLPNRACFNETFAGLLAQARGTGGEAGGDLMVMLLDLDHFKQVNDSHGHAAGDALLIEVTRRLTGTVEPGDHVARLGGDEFALLLLREAGFNDAALAARVARCLAAPMETGGAAIQPSATMGYTLTSRDGSDADGLMKNADRALYQAKGRRRGSWKRWAPGAEPAAMAG